MRAIILWSDWSYPNFKCCRNNKAEKIFIYVAPVRLYRRKMRTIWSYPNCKFGRLYLSLEFYVKIGWFVSGAAPAFYSSRYVIKCSKRHTMALALGERIGKARQKSSQCELVEVSTLSTEVISYLSKSGQSEVLHNKATENISCDEDLQVKTGIQQPYKRQLRNSKFQSPNKQWNFKGALQHLVEHARLLMFFWCHSFRSNYCAETWQCWGLMTEFQCWSGLCK